MRSGTILAIVIAIISTTYGGEAGKYRSPADLAVSPDGKMVYVSCNTADHLAVIDAKAGKVLREIPTGKKPYGVVVSPDGKTVYVTCNGSASVVFVDPSAGKITATVSCGYEPLGLILSPDGKTLFVANNISNDVSVIDVATKKETKRIAISGKSPSEIAATPDGKYLLVNTILPIGPATSPDMSARICVVDIAAGKEIRHRQTPAPMGNGRDIIVSPDGQYAFAVHMLPKFNITTTQLMQAWIQNNAVTVIPKDPKTKPFTFLLDNVNSGAANPYGLAMTKDGKYLLVTHRGIHKVTVLDVQKLKGVIGKVDDKTRAEVLAKSHLNLGLLWSRKGLIRRVDCGGRGPQGIVISPTDGRVWIANRFSDDVSVLDPKTFKVVKKVGLGGPKEMTQVRRGEYLFHDGAHCFQGWLSCTSCHPGIRADGFNWDLLNDGMTNPKNAKSLVGAAKTPPVMALGVRASMEVAVEKGFKFIQFIDPGKQHVDDVSAYLRSLKHIPSPFHRKSDGSLDSTAMNGQKIFIKAGCNECHPPPLYTDKEMYDVGTRGKRDFKKHVEFDTPSLLELYRTAPYLHDGSAAKLKDIFQKLNKDDQHGNTSKLTEKQLDELVAFLRSL